MNVSSMYGRTIVHIKMRRLILKVSLCIFRKIVFLYSIFER